LSEEVIISRLSVAEIIAFSISTPFNKTSDISYSNSLSCNKNSVKFACASLSIVKTLNPLSDNSYACNTVVAVLELPPLKFILLKIIEDFNWSLNLWYNSTLSSCSNFISKTSLFVMYIYVYILYANEIKEKG